MAKKNDMNMIIDKYGPVLKKFGDEVGEVAKKGEENVIKMSKIIKLQLDIMGLSLKKEKIYYEIGKEAAGKLIKGDTDFTSLEKFKTRLSKVEIDTEKRKKTISKVSKGGKKKATKASKTAVKKKQVA